MRDILDLMVVSFVLQQRIKTFVFFFPSCLQHIRKYGSGFLNCEGGVLIAGILDNGRLTCISFCKFVFR